MSEQESSTATPFVIMGIVVLVVVGILLCAGGGSGGGSPSMSGMSDARREAIRDEMIRNGTDPVIADAYTRDQQSK